VTTIRRDEIVDVTIKSVRLVGEDGPSGCVVIADEHNNCYPLPHQAAIKRATPQHWPPTAGEIWEDGHGRKWFAQQREGGLRLIPVYLGEDDPLLVELPQHLLDYSGPLRRIYGEEAPF